MATRRMQAGGGPLVALAVAALLGCSLLGVAHAFSMGAPDTACNNMLPGHNAAPQQTPSPFAVKMQPWEDDNGRRLVNVTLASEQGLEFRGFMIQARPETGGKVLGSFVNDVSIGKTYTCGAGLRNTATHNNKTPKKSIEIIWEAPEDYSGIVIFNATFVGDYSTFWTGVRSEKFRVNKRSAEGPGVETSSRRPATRAPATKAPAITTTTAQPRPMVAKLGSSSIYTGCITAKGCFGFPENCINSQSCVGLLTYIVRGETFEFELFAKDRVWVAAAFSDDRDMGQDSVMDCVYENGAVSLYNSWNDAPPAKANHRVEADPGTILTLVNSTYVDNALYCKFTREAVTTVEGVQFDLNKPHFLLVAAGKDFKEKSVGYHYSDKAATGEKVMLSDVKAIASASKLLVHLHGAFMLAAWIGAASTGILLARYFKQTWVGSQLCTKDQWFAWHRMLMVTTWLLTMAGFVIIFVELGAWSQANNPHAILGTITTALAFIQPFMAALRPHPNTPRRSLFNWAHWLVGNLAHIFAIVTIFFAVLLPRADLPEWMNWVLVAFVAFHVFMHFIFSIVGCASDRQGSARVTAFPMKDMGASRSPLHGMPERKQDAPYSVLRKFLLAFYIIGVFGLAIALIVIVVLAPIGTTWNNVKAMVGL